MATDQEATDQEGSVTILIKALKTDDPDAARQLWERYFADLVRLARARLRDTPRAAADEEDVALNAFDGLCRGAKGGRFPRLDNREDLWRVLLMITARKASNLIEHERRLKRGGGRVIAEAVLAAEALHADGELDQVPGRDPSPEMAALVVDEYRRLFGALPNESLRLVALLRLEGHTDEEIAASLGCGLRTVERKLQIIRMTWVANG